MSVFVNIGARLLPSLGTAATGVERRFAQMNRRLRVQAAETKLAYKEMTGAMSGMAGLAAAGGLSFGLKQIIGSGANYQHELAALRIAGRSTQEVAQAIAQANKTMRDVPTSTLVDNLKIINETTGAYGNFQHALENLSFNQKLGYMAVNLLGKDPTEVPHMLQSGIRALEIRGSAMDTERYKTEMGDLYRAMAFFKGAKGGFNMDELANFSQTGNIPIKLYNERFLSRILPSLITENGGGDIVGTQAAAFRNQIMGRVPLGGKKLTQEWVRLGLIPAPGTGGNDSKTGWSAGSVRGHSLAMQDPFAWIETVLLPAMQKGGVDTNNQQQVLTQISKMFGRETAMRFVATMADPLQRGRLHKDEKLIGQAMPLEDSYKLMLATDPNAAWAKFMASMTNLATVLGDKVFTEKTIAAIGKFADMINNLADFMDKHPNAARAGVGGMAVGALGLIGGMFGAGGLMKALFGGALKGIGRLLGTVLIRGIPLALNMFTAFFRTAMGRMFVGTLARLGPWIVRGLIMAFGLLSNPVGWAIILAGVAAALIYYFRDDIAKWWTNTLVPWWNTAWTAIKDYVTTIDWGGLGMKIADALTFGLASKINPATWGAIIKGATVGVTQGMTAGAGATAGALAGQAIAGSRALGGPIRAGQWYRVNERGEEHFMSTRPGAIIPAGGRRSGGGGGGVHVGAININGAQDPHATALAVRAELARYARQQDAGLHD